MAELSALHQRLLDRDLTFFAGAPVCFHCHHFNLFLDQTIDDALGPEEGTALRTRAAHGASRQLLAGVFAGAGAVTSAERIGLASAVFAAMGHGRLALEPAGPRGMAHGEHLHYGFCWREKYGRDVRRRHPADAFAAGFAAAALELAYDAECGTAWARETECVATRGPRCSFTIGEGTERFAPAGAGIEDAKAIACESVASIGEARIRAINGGLQQFLAGIGPDARGLVQGFGVFVTLHLTNYYNAVSYETAARLEHRAARSLPVLEELLRESGQVCAFNTFGGILLSPEWEGLVGPCSDDPGEVLQHSMAIARALGFGAWSIVEFVADRRMVVRAPTTYEAPYLSHDGGRVDRASSYFLQGGVRGLMEMAHRVPWRQRPQLDDAFYRALFKQGQRFRVEQTADVARGDRYCEVVVEAAKR